MVPGNSTRWCRATVGGVGVTSTAGHIKVRRGRAGCGRTPGWIGSTSKLAMSQLKAAGLAQADWMGIGRPSMPCLRGEGGKVAVMLRRHALFAGGGRQSGCDAAAAGMVNMRRRSSREEKVPRPLAGAAGRASAYSCSRDLNRDYCSCKGAAPCRSRRACTPPSFWPAP